MLNQVEEGKKLSTNETYWQSYYSKSMETRPPSQFAAFCVNEEFEIGFGTIIDLGCGSGRDSIFLAKYFNHVWAIDSAENAISATKRACEHDLVSNVSCIHGSVSDEQATKAIRAQIVDKVDVMYARFFIHAIDDESQLNFFKLSRSVLRPFGRIYLEYRLSEDQELKKTEPSHFRRFIVSNELASIADNMGFSLRYQVAGTGFAKYGSEDAYVARQVLVKRGRNV